MSAEDKTNDPSTSLGNVGEIIDRFGGLRPMAKKLGVAVTTVQGWKQRDAIPPARYDSIIEAARAHNVDLSGILAGAPVVEKSVVIMEEPPVRESTPEPEIAPKTERSSLPKPVVSKPQAPAKPLFQKPRSLQEHHIWINLGFACIILVAFVIVLWPHKTVNTVPVPVVPETPLPLTGQEHSFLGTILPENMVQDVEKQAGAVQETVQKAAIKVQEISQDVLAGDGATLEELAAKLGGHLYGIAASPEMAGMLQRLNLWSGDVGGQEKIQGAMAEVRSLISGFSPAGGSLETQLDAARTESPSLGAVFEGVPASDLKAAALLLGMTQFRSSLNRDNAPFAEDLTVLKTLVGTDDPTLLAALDHLAPRAEEGVLTPSGLVNEFKTVAGDVVVASLKGEDVSLAERAKAKMNDMFQVQKDGALITGTDVQAKMAQTQQSLDAGDLAQAIDIVKGLNGHAAAAAAPWLEKAEATLDAQKVKTMLDQVITEGSAAAGITLPGASQLIQNKETGINILVKPTTPGFSLPKVNPGTQ